MKEKLKVCILFGGRSVEHEISLRSARNVFQNIDRKSFEVMLIGIDKKGGWYFCKDIDEDITAGQPVLLKLDASAPGFVTSQSEKVYTFDVIFPVLHGTDGEDGSIQGIFKTVDIPLIGSGVLGSGISMDKVVSKQILKECKVPVADYLTYSFDRKDQIEFENVVAKLGLPFMIKSAALGSSVGVSKVVDQASFNAALEDSFKYDNRVILEAYVEGREMECAILGNEEPEATVPGEIILIKDYDFYDYTAKYLDEDAIEIKIPAELDNKVKEEVMATAVMAYKALQCNDYARVDLFVTQENKVIINEINTIPGFTNVSMFPMLWEHMGLSYKDLISKMITLAIDRWQKLKRVETSYADAN
jgi:D-alanine-D-alanine ligase